MSADNLFHVISRGPSLKDGTRLSIGAVAKGSDIADLDKCLEQGFVVAEAEHSPHPDAATQAVRNQRITMIHGQIDQKAGEIQELEAEAKKWGSSRASVLKESA